MTEVLVKRELLADLRDAANDCYNTEWDLGEAHRMAIYKALVDKADAILARPAHDVEASVPTFPCESCGAFHSYSEVAEAGGYCPQCEADYDERQMLADLLERYTALTAAEQGVRPMNNELLPCPFCGDDEIMDFQAHLENRVQCAMCNVSTDTFPSCEESHAAWNTRTKAAPTEPQSDSVIVPRAIAERMAIDAAQYEHEHAVVNDNVQLWQQPNARLTLTVGDLRTVRALLVGEA